MKIPGGRKKVLYVGAHDPLDEGYWPKLMALVEQKLPLKRGSVTVINIQHDEDCPKLAGGPCRCEADVVVEGED